MKTQVIEQTGPGILDTIYERRSVRKYKDQPVDREIIEKILNAGRMAPSALNLQQWKFFVLTQKETIQTFSKEISKIAAKEWVKSGPAQIVRTVTRFLHFPHGLDFIKSPDPVFHRAPVVIFIAAPAGNEWAALDIGMCAQNMMLAAKALGLDSCPVGLGKYVEHTPIYSKLKTSSSLRVHLSVIFGYGDEVPEVHKRIQDNAVFIE